MKYLVISQYFWPENFKINEVVKELSKKNEVHVLTSVPNIQIEKNLKNFFLNQVDIKISMALKFTE